MSKLQFLMELYEGLSDLPEDDVEEHVTFYSEMIDDLMEEGLSEEEAVAEIGDIDELIAQIIAEIPFTKRVKGKIVSKKRLKTWEIVLIVLGAPLWLSLLIAACAVILSLYVVLLSVIIALWAVFVSLFGCFFGCVVAGIWTSFSGNGLTGIAITSAGIICAGLSIFLFYGCKAATKGALLLTKKVTLGIKRWFIHKEEAE